MKLDLLIYKKLFSLGGYTFIAPRTLIQLPPLLIPRHATQNDLFPLPFLGVNFCMKNQHNAVTHGMKSATLDA